jgi:hypothetical protein
MLLGEYSTKQVSGYAPGDIQTHSAPPELDLGFAGVRGARTASTSAFEVKEHRMSPTKPRKGMPSPRLSESEFRRRFLAQFADPAYRALAAELDKIAVYSDRICRR